MSTTIAASARSYPKLPYQELQKEILGKSYELSLVFVGATRAKQLNEQYRKKTYVPNVLSFPLTKNAGEIYITPAVVQKEAKKWGLTPRGYVGFLFIHGLLHLKGLDHGDTMEKAEKKYMHKYKLG